jgi:hypothetical protein
MIITYKFFKINWIIINNSIDYFTWSLNQIPLIEGRREDQEEGRF